MAEAPGFSDLEVMHFARQQLRSLWVVELLELLCRDPAHVWTPAALAAQLRSADEAMTQGLQTLERIGLAVNRDGGFSYRANGDETDRLAAAVLHFYANRRIAFIAELYADPKANIRALADAFRIRGD